jgi:hypothetical protein
LATRGHCQVSIIKILTEKLLIYQHETFVKNDVSFFYIKGGIFYKVKLKIFWDLMLMVWWNSMNLLEECVCMLRGVHRVLVGKPEGKRPLGRPRHRW